MCSSVPPLVPAAAAQECEPAPLRPPRALQTEMHLHAVFRGLSYVLRHEADKYLLPLVVTLCNC
jgi:hypothetical protein